MNFDPNFNGQEINFSALTVRKYGSSKSLFTAAWLLVFGTLLNLLMEVILLIKTEGFSFDIFSILGYVASIGAIAASIYIYFGIFKFNRFCNGIHVNDNGLKCILYGVGASCALAIISTALTAEFSNDPVGNISTVLSIVLTGYVYYWYFSNVRSSINHIESSLSGKPTGKLSRLLGFITCGTFILLIVVAALFFLTNAGIEALIAVETDEALLNDLMFIEEIYDEMKYFIIALIPTAIANLLLFRLIRKYKSDTLALF